MPAKRNLSRTPPARSSSQAPDTPDRMQGSPRVEPLLTDYDLEQLTGRARSSWQKARCRGEGPRFLRLGRLVRYRASDVQAWLEAHPSLRSTSEAV
jgi:predicted DNA-binding transcriptional regulator AlpA